MRLLLLGLTGTEPAYGAWARWLSRAGVPFDAIALKDLLEPIEFEGEHGGSRFQGIILAEAGLMDIALEGSARAGLERLERAHGLRRLIAYAYPGPELGLSSPRWSGRLEELEARLTPSGRRVFPYLQERLPIDPGSWAYLASAESASRFETLVAGPDGSALVGIHRRDDGREDMVQTFDANFAQAQGQLLRSGQLAWLTGGTYIGFERNYLSIQIDDVLARNHSWSVDKHESDRRPGSSLRMTAGDARHAAGWVRSRGVRLDLAYNGAGSLQHSAAPGGQLDPLLVALLGERDAFGWINHTFGHGNLDELGQAEIEAEIERNFSWAAEVGIPVEPHTLITGAHTGLANLAATPPRPQNPHLRAALAAQRIRYLACDASRAYPARQGETTWAPGSTFAIGTAVAVPRHPTVLPHDAATPAQVLDRLRSEGHAGVTSFSQVIEAEARRVFRSVVSNDPRPHYFHQSNLICASDGAGTETSPGIFYALMDAVLERCRAHLASDVMLFQPSLSESGRLLLRLQAWRDMLDLGSVRAYLEPTRVVMVNYSPASLEAPITGTVVGDRHGAGNSGWLRLAPGETVLERQTTKRDPTRDQARAASQRSGLGLS
jgi:hypothetical protein